jgi:hypothetical protein
VHSGLIRVSHYQVREQPFRLIRALYFQGQSCFSSRANHLVAVGRNLRRQQWQPKRRQPNGFSEWTWFLARLHHRKKQNHTLVVLLEPGLQRRDQIEDGLGYVFPIAHPLRRSTLKVVKGTGVVARLELAHAKQRPGKPGFGIERHKPTQYVAGLSELILAVQQPAEIPQALLPVRPQCQRLLV